MNKKIYFAGILVVLTVVSGVSYGYLSGRHTQNGPTTTMVSSIMMPRTVEEMSGGSYAAVVGTVADTSVAREKSFVRPGELDIVTTATIKIEKYLSNPNKLNLSTIDVKTLGGTVGDDSMVADGWPEFVPGTKVIVFLNKIGEGKYTVYGTAQGKFTVNDDGTLGTEREKPFMDSVFDTETTTLTELESKVSAAVR